MTAVAETSPLACLEKAHGWSDPTVGVIHLDAAWQRWTGSYRSNQCIMALPGAALSATEQPHQIALLDLVLTRFTRKCADTTVIFKCQLDLSSC